MRKQAVSGGAETSCFLGFAADWKANSKYWKNSGCRGRGNLVPEFRKHNSTIRKKGGALTRIRPPEHSATHVTLARPGRTFIQTERATHEAWARLILASNRSAQLMHILCAQLDDTTNAVVISQKTLAKLMNCTERTIRNSLQPLINGHWIQVVQIGQAGTVNAYVVNSTVAWTKGRDDLHLSSFHARVIADAEEQKPGTVEMTGKLRTVPLLYPGELQLPTGAGLPPPSEPALPGMEPDLPARRKDLGEDDAA